MVSYDWTMSPEDAAIIEKSLKDRSARPKIKIQKCPERKNMTNKNLTDITIVLDRSGSMGSIRSDVESGINAFVEDQRKVEGDAVFTLVEFDSQDTQNVVYNAVPLDSVSKYDSFKPRGWTPLYDALGLAITRTGERLANLPEHERPGQVLFVVFTDGLENASTEYTQKSVTDMIKHQEEVYSWSFVFLGSGISAESQGGSVGVSAGTCASLVPDNVTKAFSKMSDNARKYRGSSDKEDLCFTDMDKADLLS